MIYAWRKVNSARLEIVTGYRWFVLYIFWHPCLHGNNMKSCSMLQVASFFDLLCLHIHCCKNGAIVFGRQTRYSTFDTMFRNGSTRWRSLHLQTSCMVISPSYSTGSIKPCRDGLFSRCRIGRNFCGSWGLPGGVIVGGELDSDEICLDNSVPLSLSPLFDSE